MVLTVKNHQNRDGQKQFRLEKVHGSGWSDNVVEKLLFFNDSKIGDPKLMLL